MPVISRFHGITIKMYFRQKEHNPTHIHAICGDYVGIFSIENGEMIEGDISIKGQQLIKDFVDYYRDRLVYMWETQEFEMLPPIEA